MLRARRRFSLAAVLGAFLAACVHLPRPQTPFPARPAPAPLEGALPFYAVLDSNLAAADPALSARLRALDAAGDHDGVFTRGDAWAAGEGTQLFADLHVHPFMNRALPFFTGGLDSSRIARSPTTILRTQMNLPTLARSANNVLFASVYVDLFHVTARGRMKAALRQIDAAKTFAAAHPDRVEIAYSAADVRRIVASHRTAIVL
ncbi:MAG TPA: hypothetical protein VMV18_11030, partial [bacterium]|nr:hypothetical protein [bacterium]